MLLNPLDDDRVLVGGVIVDDEMQGQLGRRLPVELL
jgi:hypothetical protein